MIEFKDLIFGYEKGQPVLQNISLEIHDNESVGLIGANGAGKSTLLRLIPGLLESRGEILVDGMPVERANYAEIRRRLGFVLQDPDDQMFMPTVYEDMIFAPLNYGMSKAEADARVDGVLSELGLEYLKHRYNHKLSGGEKRMAAIATVLAMEPKYVLMDEPTTALDPVNRRTVINTVKGLKMTRLIASHDLDMVMDTCDRVILLSEGRVIADGPAEDILRNRALLESNRMELPLCLQGDAHRV